MPELFFGTTRHADLPLHYGKVPVWLAERMQALGGAIVEAIILQNGRSDLLARFSDPFWFQAFGCVLGMDWHSSGVTTSVMGALKGALNHRFNELGIYVCGGKGRHSRQTPAELLRLADRTGLDGMDLVRSSRLTAKVDNNAVQDGFQVYMHSFIVSREGEWAVVQQGMNTATGMARRYHWHSAQLSAFTMEPHTFIYGHNVGRILNLTHREASDAKQGMITLCGESPARMLPELQKLSMPSHHDVRAGDVDLKRLGSVLALAYDKEISDFESLLLLEGVGPRTIQSLALVSEVINGTPTRFTDPARFSFAHGGKDGHPFPVPLKVYDETIDLLRQGIEGAKIGAQGKMDALNNLSIVVQEIEKSFVPNANFYKVIERERRDSHKYGGMSVYGPSKPSSAQLSLF